MTNFLTCRDKVTFSDVVATARQFERSQHTHLQAVAQPRQPIRSSRTSLVSSTDDSLGQFTKHVEQLMRPIVESVTQLTLAVQQRQSPEVYPQNHPPPTRQETQCGRQGHITRFCPAMQQSQLNQSPQFTQEYSLVQSSTVESLSVHECHQQLTEGCIPGRVEPDNNFSNPVCFSASYPEVSRR